VREIKALWLGIEPTVIMVQQLPIEWSAPRHCCGWISSMPKRSFIELKSKILYPQLTSKWVINSVFCLHNEKNPQNLSTLVFSNLLYLSSKFFYVLQSKQLDVRRCPSLPNHPVDVR
jgi:hypothetical protein